MPKITYGDMRSNAEKIMDARVKARVLRGIELLNERYGPDWVDRVELDVLMMDDGEHCVLGQLYSDRESATTGYMLGCKSLFGESGNVEFSDDRVPAVLDYCAAVFGFTVETHEDFDHLGDAWRVALGGSELATRVGKAGGL